MAENQGYELGEASTRAIPMNRAHSPKMRMAELD